MRSGAECLLAVRGPGPPVDGDYELGWTDVAMNVMDLEIRERSRALARVAGLEVATSPTQLAG